MFTNTISMIKHEDGSYYAKTPNGLVPMVQDKAGTWYTNKHRVSAPMVAAILKDRYTDPDEKTSDYSASTLVAPTLQTVLQKRHADSLLVRDVTDLFYSFMGSVAHQVLEDSWIEMMGGIVEKRLYDTVHGKEISGKLDRYLEGAIRDYKTCKVYKIQKGEHTDWEAQQNIYAHLCRLAGLPVNSLHIAAMIFDWKAGETYKENYPLSPIITLDLNLWAEPKAKAYIDDRVMRLIEAEKIEDDAALSEAFPCSNHEMWKDLKDISVMKEGGKKATRTFKDLDTAREEAAQYMVEKGYAPPEYTIVERYSDRTRCLGHCDVAHLCPQNKWLFEQEGRDDFEEHYRPFIINTKELS